MVFDHPGRVSNQELYDVFVKAFSDYKAPLGLRPQDFNIRIYQKLQISDPLSVVALSDESPVGFIFHAQNIYEGIPTLYNGGTGVIPQLRKQGLATKMYEWIFPALAKSKSRRIVLEVIRQNKRAIKLYESLGFTFKRTFHCFKLKENLESDMKLMMKYEQSVPEINGSLINYQAGFIDSDAQLNRNLANEKIIVAVDDQQDKIGYVIFQPHIGRISRLAFSEAEIGRALVYQARLLSAKKELTILNIPEDAYPMLDALSDMGFKNEIDQYEMELYF